MKILEQKLGKRIKKSNRSLMNIEKHINHLEIISKASLILEQDNSYFQKVLVKLLKKKIVTGNLLKFWNTSKD